jgi:hypothetical protein
MQFQCQWCGFEAELGRAGWPYVRSFVLLHMAECPARPQSLTQTEIDAVAEEAADRLSAET